MIFLLQINDLHYKTACVLTDAEVGGGGGGVGGGGGGGLDNQTGQACIPLINARLSNEISYDVTWR